MAIKGLSIPAMADYSYDGNRAKYTNGFICGSAVEYGVDIETTDDNHLRADNRIKEHDYGTFNSGTLTLNTSDLDAYTSKRLLGLKEVKRQIGEKTVTELVYDDDAKTKSNSYVDNLFCDRFQTDTNNSAKNDNTITGHWDSTLYPDRNWIYITKTDVESVSALKTWLQSNPVTVVYKLAVPVEERITAEEAYNLRTYAPYSTVWTSDDLNPVFLVDTAKNLAGAYALEGYVQAKKNETTKDNGSETNRLSQRIEKIEELMKNTLTISE